MTPFTIAKSKQKQNQSIKQTNRKNLGVTLTKQARDLYGKNFKSLRKEIEEGIKRWKGYPCSWIHGIDRVKMLSLPYHRIPIKILTQFFTGLERTTLIFIGKDSKSS